MRASEKQGSESRSYERPFGRRILGFMRAKKELEVPTSPVAHPAYMDSRHRAACVIAGAPVTATEADPTALVQIHALRIGRITHREVARHKETRAVAALGIAATIIHDEHGLLLEEYAALNEKHDLDRHIIELQEFYKRRGSDTYLRRCWDNAHAPGVRPAERAAEATGNALLLVAHKIDMPILRGQEPHL